MKNTHHNRETSMRIAFRNAEPSAPAHFAGVIRRKLKTRAGLVPLRRKRT